MQSLGFLGTAPGRIAAGRHLGREVVMLVRHQKRRHQEHAGIAYLAYRGQHLARLFVDMGGQFLEMGFLAIIAGYCIGTAVDHYVYQRHVALAFFWVARPDGFASLAWPMLPV